VHVLHPKTNKDSQLLVKTVRTVPRIPTPACAPSEVFHPSSAKTRVNTKKLRTESFIRAAFVPTHVRVPQRRRCAAADSRFPRLIVLGFCRSVAQALKACNQVSSCFLFRIDKDLPPKIQKFDAREHRAAKQFSRIISSSTILTCCMYMPPSQYKIEFKSSFDK
jgi:hypothetical protein